MIIGDIKETERKRERESECVNGDRKNENNIVKK